MVTIGTDCHKQSHTLVAVDPVGRKVAELMVPHTPAKYPEVHVWAVQLDTERVWGIENSGSFGRGLAQYLVRQGEVVYEVSPQLTGRKRRASVDRDKSNATDALAVSRVVVQDAPKLPRILPEDPSSVLGIVVEHRDNLVGERTRLVNQLHAQLVHLDPTYKATLGALTEPKAVTACQTYPFPPDADPVATMRVQVVRQLATLLLQLTDLIAHLETNQIMPLVEQAQTSLLSIPGIAHLTAAKLMARVGPITAIKSAAALARMSGIAPVQRSSASYEQHRVNGGGDRQ